MRNVQATPAIEKSDAKFLSQALDQEAGELDALHAGLVRHLDAWRDAHETAVLRLAAVMARMDAILARIERNDR